MMATAGELGSLRYLYCFGLCHEVFDSLHASDVLKEIEVTMDINASSDKYVSTAVSYKLTIPPAFLYLLSAFNTVQYLSFD